MPIKLLEPQLANQIAAGEVVERPASVVKELIENSIDAGADRIELTIEKGGHKRIKITDNGSGIAKDELTLALSRHATSKITTLNDLENILSLGFRGEALASISSVSRLTLTSKTADQEQAWQAHCEGRDMAVKLNPAAHPDGTTIDVADLFYNTPARRKFLRTEKTEFQHIEDVVKRIALSHADIAFSLTHNGKIIRRYPVRKGADRAARIAAVAGNRFVDNAVYTEVDYDGIRLEAWLGNEKVLRSSPDCQFSFVNGRGMRDKLILHAIRQAYESVWGVIEQPSFVVYLHVPPKDVDVNVHPAKHEVRFQQSRLVHDFIVKTVADALSEESSGESSRAPSDGATHDYIRPLTPGWSGQPVQARENKLSQRDAGFSTQRTSPFPAKPPSAGNHPQAARHYQSLMAAPDMPDQSESAIDFLPLTHDARLYINGDTTSLLSVADIAELWMQRNLTVKTTSQPLLMPVSIAGGDIDEPALSRFAQWHIIIAQNAGKLRLQQVPSGTRHWPWASWFPLLMDGLPSTLEEAVSLVTRRGVPLPDTMTSEVWQWFGQQAQQFQWETAVEFGKVRAMENLVELLSQ